MKLAVALADFFCSISDSALRSWIAACEDVKQRFYQNNTESVKGMATSVDICGCEGRELYPPCSSFSINMF